jgi:hypothetical protein
MPGTLTRFLLALPLALVVLGCGSSQSPPAQDPVAAAHQSLQGTWRLLSFRPATSLEPPLQSLLEAQMSTLTITIEGDLFTAMGAGINTHGRILIRGVEGDVVLGTLYDRMGAGHGVSGRFVGNQFQFSSLSPPWQGGGVLERAAN